MENPSPNFYLNRSQKPDVSTDAAHLNVSKFSPQLRPDCAKELHLSKGEVVVFIAPPRAGKGTQAKLLGQGIHLSTGSLLRAEVASGSQLGRQLEVIMNRGDLPGDELTIGIIEQAIADTGKKGCILLDGYPRQLSHVDILDEFLGKYELTLKAVVYLDVPFDELLNRGRTDEASSRSDDDNSVFRYRYSEVFVRETFPLVEVYECRGKLVRIDARGSVEETQACLRQSLAALVKSNE